MAKDPFYLVTEFCVKVSVSALWEYLLLIEKLQVTSTELSATCPQQPKMYRLREFNVFKVSTEFCKVVQM